jgi:hypothetical protein
MPEDGLDRFFAACINPQAEAYCAPNGHGQGVELIFPRHLTVIPSFPQPFHRSQPLLSSL